MEANQYLGGAGRFRNRNPGKSIIQAFVSRASVSVARAAVLWLGLAPRACRAKTISILCLLRRYRRDGIGAIATASGWRPHRTYRILRF